VPLVELNNKIRTHHREMIPKMLDDRDHAGDAYTLAANEREHWVGARVQRWDYQSPRQ
jgi:hypothetical protein